MSKSAAQTRALLIRSRSLSLACSKSDSCHVHPIWLCVEYPAYFHVGFVLKVLIPTDLLTELWLTVILLFLYLLDRLRNHFNDHCPSACYSDRHYQTVPTVVPYRRPINTSRQLPVWTRRCTCTNILARSRRRRQHPDSNGSACSVKWGVICCCVQTSLGVWSPNACWTILFVMCTCVFTAALYLD